MIDAPKLVVENDELNKAIQGSLDPAAISALVMAEATKQRDAASTAAADQAAADKAAADKVAAEVVATDAGFTRTLTIGGREFTFDAPSELELERAVNNALLVAYSLQNTEAPAAAEIVVSAADAAKAAEAEVVAKAELELKFKRGEISAKEYIEQSGAIKSYLEEQGVPLDELRASIDQNRSNTFEKSWEQATVEFLKTGGGSDWPGGEKNLELIGLKIGALNLVDAEDKVAALAQAWSSMKESKMYFPYEAPATETAAPAVAAAAVVVPPAADPAAAAAAAAQAAADANARAAAAAEAAKRPAASSAMFGMSSGVGEGVSAPAPKGDVKIDPNASPAEIIAAWKAQTIAAGKDPNAAFMETFSGRRA